MSHLKERKDKDCLNCGAEVQGRFCQVCGQENIEPKESFWHLVTHFMYDVTHFDGKFFSTLKYLLFRPGFLSHEYLRGRRASYLHPIRMYVFTSAFFFLIFFGFKKEEEAVVINETQQPTSAATLLKKLQKSKAKQEKTLASADVPEIAKVPLRVVLKNIDSDIALLQRDTTAKDKLKTLNNKSSETLNIFGDKTHNLKTVAQYDSAQLKLPKDERDNFFVRRFARQNIHLREKYNDSSKEIIKAIVEKFKHLFPQMLFVSLPLFALMLQLLYARRKRFYYVNHVVFVIHLYCGTFIILLASMAVEGIFNLFHAEEWGVLKGLFVLANFYYWYKSMRNFYEQRRGKTVLKYMLVLFMALILMGVIFTLFFIFSAMSI